MAGLLKAERPALILLPHEHDGNATHIGVHRLVMEALALADIATALAQTEFWSTQAEPNWMVETSVADTARLIQRWPATSARSGATLIISGCPPSWPTTSAAAAN